MTKPDDKLVEVVARAIYRTAMWAEGDPDAPTLDRATLIVRGEGAKEWERFVAEARAAIDAIAQSQRASMEGEIAEPSALFYEVQDAALLLAEARQAITNPPCDDKRIEAIIRELDAHGDKDDAAAIRRLQSQHASMEGEVAEYREALNIIVMNAALIPDPATGEATDCYAVPIDDIEEAMRTLNRKPPEPQGEGE